MTSAIRHLRINKTSIINALKYVQNKRIMKAAYLPIPADDYDNFPTELACEFIGDGGLIVEGLGSPVVVKAATAVDSVTDIGEGEGCTIGFAGTPFVANAYHGMYLHVVTGDGAGALYPIFKNANNSITIGYNASVAAIEVADTVAVVTPPVTITVDHTIGMKFGMVKPAIDGTGFNYRSRVQFSGINFIFEDIDVDYQEALRIVTDGCGVNFTFCTITLADETHIVNIGDGTCVNNSYLADCLTDIQATALYDTMAPGLLIESGSIPSATPINLQLGCGSMASFISCRGSVKTGGNASVGRSASCNVRYSQLGGFVRNGGSCDSLMNYIEPCAATEYPYDCTEAVYDYINSCTILSGKDAIRQKGGEIRAYKLTTTTAVTDYDLNIAQQGKFTIVGDSCTLAANTGDVWFAEKAADNAVAWPAQGALITDSLGSSALNSA